MIVLIDTDILLRAALFPDGSAAAALKKAFGAPFRPHVRAAALAELRRRLEEIAPEAPEEAEAFVFALTETVTALPEPANADCGALDDSVNLLLTGDRAMLSANDPRVLDAAEFLAF